jgi:putative FmdB family regulatory protein
MPIYEYQCDECGHLFEEMKKRTDPEPAECPQCGAPKPRRAISRTGFKLKGNGWYVTDYKSNGGSSAASNGASADAGTDSGDSGTESGGDSDAAEPEPATENVA